MRGLAVVILLAACGGSAPKAGDGCVGTVSSCMTGQLALECRNGVYRHVACRGGAGCQKSGDTLTCDQSANQAGDACLAAREGQSVCAGGRTLACENGELVDQGGC